MSLKNHKIFKNYSNPRKWFNVNTESETPELLIYDAIGADFWGDAVSPKAFVAELRAIEKNHKSLNLRINSPGGFVHDGFTIYNALKQSPLDITAYVDGLAASAAAFILMGANKILIPSSAEIMIHDPWGLVMGGAENMRAEAAHLDGLKEMIADIFVARTGNEKTVVLDLMKAESWLSGEKAMKLGFADELLEDSKATACAFELDDDLLPGLPDHFKRYQNALKKRANEQALRDAGLSRAEAARRASESDSSKNGLSEIKEMLKANIQKLQNNTQEKN